MTDNNYYDIYVGFDIVLSPTKFTISSAYGKIIMLKPGGVWKWFY